MTDVITVNTEYGTLKARRDNLTVYWADGGVWENWPRLEQAGILRSEAMPNTYGDTAIYLTEPAALAARLAADVLPEGGDRAGFDALPLRERLGGLALLAEIGGDAPVRDACLAAIKAVAK